MNRYAFLLESIQILQNCTEIRLHISREASTRIQCLQAPLTTLEMHTDLSKLNNILVALPSNMHDVA